MPRLPLLILAAVAVAGCQPAVPNSGIGGRGIGGQGSYQRYEQTHGGQAPGSAAAVQANADLMIDSPTPGAAAGADSGDTLAHVSADTSTAPAAIGADTLAALQATNAGGSTTSGDSGAMSPVSGTVSSGGVISGGVAGGRSAGTPLNAMSQSTLTGGTTDTHGPTVQPATETLPASLVSYAKSVHNLPGQTIYKRFKGQASASARACAGYSSPNQAQIAFLKAGGPQNDPLNLDPDGDGFACGWDPRALRTVSGN